MADHMSNSGSEFDPGPDLNAGPTPGTGPVAALLKIVGVLALLLGLSFTIAQMIEYFKSGKAGLLLAGIAVVVATFFMAAIWMLRTRRGVLIGAGFTLGAVAILAVTILYFVFSPNIGGPPDRFPSAPTPGTAAAPTATSEAPPGPKSRNDDPAGCSGNLLASPWRLEASHGPSERYANFVDTNMLAGKSIVRVTYDLHGLQVREGPRKDQSALIFNQPTWYVVSFANYGRNEFDGEQTVDFPLEDFIGLPDAESGAPGGNPLDTSRPVGAVRVRIWHYEPYIVDISSIRLCN